MTVKKHLRIMSVVVAGAMLAGSVVSPVAALEGSVGGAAAAGPVSIGGRGAYYDSQGGDGNWFGGAQLRVHLTRAFALEGSADIRKTEAGPTDIDVFPVQASILAYLLPDRQVSPFLLFGPGWYFTRIEGPGGLDETEHRFGLHAGGGLQIFLSRYWSVDSTYRYVWIEDVTSRDAALQNKDFEDRGHMITAALNFHF